MINRIKITCTDLFDYDTAQFQRAVFLIMKKVVLHIDMDAFYAAVEQRDNPSLRGRPVIVGSPPDRRGVVATCSYEARIFGVRSAMPSREAYQRCPQAVFVAPDMRRYQYASEKVFEIFSRYSPTVEPLSIDEAFIDVSGVRRLLGSPRDIACSIRSTIRDELGLPASVGIAGNKFLAKLASEKAKPDGCFEMSDDREEIIRWLGRLEVGELWGVGRVSRKTLENAGLRKVVDIQRCDRRKLAGLCGQRFADHLVNLSFGIDAREVETTVAEKSISKETTFNKDVSDRPGLLAVLLNLCDEVGSRLRSQGYTAQLCRIKLRWSDFKTITRQQHFPSGICDDFSIRELAVELFNREKLVAPVRLIGVGVAALNHRHEQQQLLLFDDQKEEIRKRERISRAVDNIRAALGDQAIARASRFADQGQPGNPLRMDGQ